MNVDDDDESCSCTPKHEQCYSEVNKCPFLSVCNSETIIQMHKKSESRKLTHNLRTLLAFQNR